MLVLEVVRHLCACAKQYHDIHHPLLVQECASIRQTCQQKAKKFHHLSIVVF